jgi:TRAP-type uncharacterized transport system fused permease subunit
MEVHMFMLFYASLSAISPPVAVAALAAAAIANAKTFKLMPYACKLSVGGFVVPFFFVFNSGVLMQGGLFSVLSDTAVCAVMVITASLVLHGHIRQRPLAWWPRGFFALAALAMAVPQLAVQYAAAAAAIALFLFLHRDARQAELKPT